MGNKLDGESGVDVYTSSSVTISPVNGPKIFMKKENSVKNNKLVHSVKAGDVWDVNGEHKQFYEEYNYQDENTKGKSKGEKTKGKIKKTKESNARSPAEALMGKQEAGEDQREAERAKSARQDRERADTDSDSLTEEAQAAESKEKDKFLTRFESEYDRRCVEEAADNLEPNHD